MDPKDRGKSTDAHEEAKAKLEAKHEAAELQQRQEQAMADMKAKFAASREARESQVEIIDVVELDYETTLSHLALKYYGHATPKYYNYIWEHNKDQLGDSPNNSKPGMKIRIPKLPPDFDKS
jgi:nucleoid-associated protein YgaU